MCVRAGGYLGLGAVCLGLVVGRLCVGLLTGLVVRGDVGPVGRREAVASGAPHMSFMMVPAAPRRIDARGSDRLYRTRLAVGGREPGTDAHPC